MAHFKAEVRFSAPALCLVVVGLCLSLEGPCVADVVVPTERVSVGVNVRAQPSASSQILDVLEPGEQLAYLSSVAGWHEVQLPGGGSGFVSKAWTRVLSDGAPPPTPAEPSEPAAGTPPLAASADAYDFWLSEAFVQKLASQNTLMFPMRVRLEARSEVHSLGSDCEMHIAGHPVDAEDTAAPPGVVVEPPNLCKNQPPGGGTWADFVDQSLIGQTCTVIGFPRIFDEHLVGDETPTNPHHMLEIHPALKIDCDTADLDATGFLAYHEGMSEIQASSAATCFDTRLWVRQRDDLDRYEFLANRHRYCGNFASFELSVFTEWIRQLSNTGHSAIVRVRPEGMGYRTLKIYTYPGTPADALLASFMGSADPHHGAYLHGMLTFDYFSIIKTLRNQDGSWKSVPEWTEVPFPLALVVFGGKEDPDPEE